MIGVTVRLQGGPFDGKRDRLAIEEEDGLPAHVYVVLTPAGDLRFYSYLERHSELYTHDTEADQEHLYVFTDPRFESPTDGLRHREKMHA